jgi:hypothetical protein
MSIYIVIFALLLGVPLFLGVVHLVNKMSLKRRVARGRRKPQPLTTGERNIEPVTLDRNPEMPHHPGATS